MMRHKQGIPLLLAFLFLLGSIPCAFASRFSLFALDIQVPLEEGRSVGETRKVAIAKGLQEAVEEATYRIVPDQGLDTTYQKLKSNIFDKAGQFVPQYKILGEKKFPGTFELSLQVTVDTVLLRRALLKLGLLRPAEKGSGQRITLKIQNLTSGKTLMEVMRFFNQRPDLAENFRLEAAHHGDFTFSFIPLQTLKEIVSQFLYQARISQGTFEVVKQDKDLLVLQYHLEKPS